MDGDNRERRDAGLGDGRAGVRKRGQIRLAELRPIDGGRNGDIAQRINVDPGASLGSETGTVEYQIAARRAYLAGIQRNRVPVEKNCRLVSEIGNLSEISQSRGTGPDGRRDCAVGVASERATPGAFDPRICGFRCAGRSPPGLPCRKS